MKWQEGGGGRKPLQLRKRRLVSDTHTPNVENHTQIHQYLLSQGIHKPLSKSWSQYWAWTPHLIHALPAL